MVTGRLSKATGFDLGICSIAGIVTLALFALSGLPGSFYYDDLMLTRDGHGTEVSPSTFTRYELARPLTLFTYYFDYRRAGLSPGAFHWTNFVIHAVNAALCAAILLALGSARWMALLGGLTFSFHFVVIESVNYIWARSGLLSSLAILTGLLLMARDRGTLGFGRAALIALIFVLGFLARPDAFLLLLFAFLMAAVYQRTLWQRSYLVFTPFLLAAGVLVWARLSEPRDRSMGFDLGYSVGQWISAALAAALKYCELLFRPDLGSLYHPNPELSWSLWPGFAAVLILGLVAIAHRTRPLAVWGAAVIGACIVFVLLVPNLETVADRRIYLAAFGVALVWVGVFGAYPGRMPMVVASLLPLSLAVIAVQRNLEWSQPPRILERAERIYPDSAKVQMLLGDYYASRDFQRSVQHLKRAVALDPRLRDAHALLGNVYLDRGLWAQAESEFRAELEIRPRSPYALNGLGVLEVTRKRYGLARQYFRSALRAQPDYEPARENLRLIADQP